MGEGGEFNDTNDREIDPYGSYNGATILSKMPPTVFETLIFWIFENFRSRGVCIFLPIILFLPHNQYVLCTQIGFQI